MYLLLTHLVTPYLVVKIVDGRPRDALLNVWWWWSVEAVRAEAVRVEGGQQWQGWWR